MTTTLSAAPAPTTRRRSMAAVLTAVSIPMFMVTLDNLVVTTALPVIKTHAACALATEPWQLTAARALQGAAGAAVMPLSLTLLAAEVPARMRNAAVGIWSGISGLGVAVGPVVGGAVTDGLHWTWIFWLNVPVGLLVLPLVAVVLRESRGGAGKLDPLGLVLSAAAVFALVWGVVHGEDRGWTSTSVLTALVGGTVLLAAFFAWERRAAAPMLPLRLFRSRPFTVVNTVAFAFSVGVFGAIFLLAQFMQVSQGMSPLEAGLRTLPWTMAPMVVAPITGLLLVNRFGTRAPIVTGLVLLSVALGWLAIVSTVDVSYGTIVLPLALAGVGMGLEFAPMSTVALGSVSADMHGVASGTLNTIRELGVAVGVAVLASVFSAYGDYESPAGFAAGLEPAVWVGAAVVAAGALVAFLLPRTTVAK